MAAAGVSGARVGWILELTCHHRGRICNGFALLRENLLLRRRFHGGS
jgi:two-component system, cell cycle response regulator DivK